MKTRTHIPLGLLAALAGLSSLHPQLSAAPLGAAFTYQGRLNDGVNLASGIYDFRLAIYGGAEGNAQVGTTLTNAATSVTNGLFTVTLDFGPGVWNGDARWLDIAVRTNGGGAFTTLNPRQQLTPAPYALYAPNAGAATTADSAAGVGANGVANASLQANAVTTDKIVDGTIAASDLSPEILSNTFWRLGGNAGTTAGIHFLGTTDNQPLEISANSQRALRLEPDATSPNVIGGFSGNVVGVGNYGATIGGGGSLDWSHAIFADFATIGGGCGNFIQTGASIAAIGGGILNSIQTNANYATIGGGSRNRIQPYASSATIGGGHENTIDADSATIGGGYLNSIQTGAQYATIGGGDYNMIQTNAQYATVGGGRYNMIQLAAHHATIGGGDQNTIQRGAQYATIPGGYLNRAANFAFAAGRKANADHTGAFVWADSTEGDFGSTGENQFLVRAAGGVGININNPQSALHVNGTVTATHFAGNGAGLAALDSSQLTTGTVPDERLSDRVSLLGPSIESAEIADGTIGAADVAANTFWGTGGNAGTMPGTHFLGTTDIWPLELRVNNQRGLRLEPGGSASVNVVGGWLGNGVAWGVAGATVAGGGAGNWGGSACTNRVEADFGTVSGGAQNTIQTYARYATVGGGEKNTIEASSAIIGGGGDNTIQTAAHNATIGGGSYNTIQTGATGATIGGGEENTIEPHAWRATIGGGLKNMIQTRAYSATISGGEENTIQPFAEYATIPGGRLNSATNFAFAAGCQAKANHAGAFVWGDSTGADIVSTNADSVTMRASGGYRLCSNADATAGVYLAPGGGSWTSLSDRHAKEHLQAVNAQAVLEKVAALPLATWNYKTQDKAVRHLGPMAQDFHAAFGVGESDTGITSVDADGVALAAIQGLNQKLEARSQEVDVRSQKLEARNAALEKEVAELKALVKTLAEKVNGGGQ